ncbi:MAG: hypothetical protein NTZ87_00915 [Candidatus Nomurabacteria bacterium]|nr:hypothetical protein [Candidatus Nomurabacteria bacterium]
MNILIIILIVIVTFLLVEFFRYLFGFHSFFKKQKDRWIGFDLDGTLAINPPHGKFNPKIIGNPISPMIELLQKYINEGKEVKIFTGRVSTNGTILSVYNAIITRYFIQKWCKKNIGKKMDIVSTKDFKMKLLYDDSVIQVKTDTGEII